MGPGSTVYVPKAKAISGSVPQIEPDSCVALPINISCWSAIKPEGVCNTKQTSFSGWTDY